MRDGRQRAEWEQTAALLAMLFNCHRDAKKSRPARPDDYNPYAERTRGTITADSIDILKTVFVDNKPK